MFQYDIAPGFDILGVRVEQVEEITGESEAIVQSVEEGNMGGTVQVLEGLRPDGDDVMSMTLASLKITDLRSTDVLAPMREGMTTDNFFEEDNTDDEGIPVVTMVADRIMGYAKDVLREWKMRRSDQARAMTAGLGNKRKISLTEGEEIGLMELEAAQNGFTEIEHFLKTDDKNLTELETNYSALYARLRAQYNIPDELPSLHAITEDDSKTWKQAISGKNRPF